METRSKPRFTAVAAPDGSMHVRDHALDLVCIYTAGRYGVTCWSGYSTPDSRLFATQAFALRELSA